MKFLPVTCIIAHGDGDGTIAAAACRKAGAQGKLICTQPFLLHKLPDLTDPTVIVDIAVDNKNPQATIEWVKRNASNIVALIDHHAGGEAFAEVLGERFIYDPLAPSCPALMTEHGFDVPAEWVAAANTCDRPTEYSATKISTRYNSAFKVALVALQNGDKQAVEKVQTAFIDELTSGNESLLVTERATQYPLLEAATKTASEKIEEFCSGVGAVEVAAGQGSVDMTALLTGGYKKFPVIAVATTAANTGESIVIVATNRKDLDLVQAFGLGSGTPFRVVLTGEKTDLVYIKSILS